MKEFKWTDTLIKEWVVEATLQRLISGYGWSEYNKALEKFIKEKQSKQVPDKKSKVILFTTDDHAPVYEMTEYFIVEVPSYRISKSIGIAGAKKHINQFYFSTNAAAETFVLNNAPKLSIEEIKTCCYDNSGNAGIFYLHIDRLVELVKSKLK
jgi:hypothetical protein